MALRLYETCLIQLQQSVVHAVPVQPGAESIPQHASFAWVAGAVQLHAPFTHFAE